MKKKLFNLLGLLSTIITAHADSVYGTGVTSATAATGTVNPPTGTPFTDAIRLVYSREIEFKALPLMRFLQFAQTKTELGVEPGLTISMLTYNNLRLGGVLTENVDMTTQALSGSTKQITVFEHGNAVAVSELLINSSFDDVLASATTLLSRDYSMVVDCELRDVALSNSNNIVYGGGKSARSAVTSADTLSVATIKDCIEILATNNAPKYNGAYWICFVHPHQSRTLRDDPAWINASNYGAPDQLFTGEIGRIDDTRFIETTILCNGAAATDDPSYKADLVAGAGETGSTNAVNIYQAVLFGDAYFAIATSLPVELRDNGVEDFGRKRSLAWYSIFGTGLLHPDYGVVIETA